MNDETDDGRTPPAGWYPDPETAGMQRWWDGQGWTEHQAPMAPNAGPVAAPQPWSGPGTPQPWSGPGGGPAGASGAGIGAPGAAPGGAYVPGAAGSGSAGMVDTWLWQSISAAILCCQPLGIAGVVFSAQAQNAINVGDMAQARRKADLARTFTLVSAGLAVALWVGFIGFFVVSWSALFFGL